MKTERNVLNTLRTWGGRERQGRRPLWGAPGRPASHPSRGQGAGLAAGAGWDPRVGGAGEKGDGWGRGLGRLSLGRREASPDQTRQGFPGLFRGAVGAFPSEGGRRRKP